ncbi:MAG: hypothetical protein COB37_08980 [Kordiimonadales bacterium]|nr:MAG: hypothetical protein COB37_08980 [Kordiimonadales bacterium]
MNLMLKAVPKRDYKAFGAAMNDPQISAASIAVPYPVTAEYVAERLGKSAKAERSDGTINERGIYAGGTLVGGGSIFTNDSGEREIGYFIGQDHRRKGYASLAAYALVKLYRALGHVGLLVAHHLPENIASGKVLEKAGFKACGTENMTNAKSPTPIEMCRLELQVETAVDPVTVAPLMWDDVEPIFSLQDDRKAARMAMSGDAISFDLFKQRMERMLVADPKDAGMSIIWVGGKRAGYVGYGRKKDGKLAIDYQVARNYWGQGIATKAVYGFMQALPDVAQRETMYAVVIADNIGSQKVMEKCGFTEARRAMGYSILHKRQVEQILYQR